MDEQRTTLSDEEIESTGTEQYSAEIADTDTDDMDTAGSGGDDSGADSDDTDADADDA
jgi:hypothetical protein